MDKEQINKLKAFFVKCYVTILIVMTSAIFITYMVFDVIEMNNIVCLLAIAAVFILDMASNKLIKPDKNLLIIFIKTSVLMCFMAYIANIAVASYTYKTAICMVLACMYIFEMAFICDFSDAGTKNITVILCAVIIFIENVVAIVFSKSFDSTNALILVVMYGMFLLYFYVILASACSIENYFDKKVFAQARLIDEINNTNDELIKNQEKVSKTNENLGIQKVKLEAAYKQIKRINSEMTIQNEIVKYISTSLNVERLLSMITESIMGEINVQLCAIMVNKEIVQKDEMLYKISSSYSGTFVDTFTNFIKKGKFPKQFDNVRVIVDNNVDQKNYVELGTNLVGSLLCISLELNNKSIGKFYVGSSQFNYFNDNIAFFETIVAQINIAINNAHMYQNMQDMAVRDGLTGIYNRRYLNNTYDSFVNEIEESKEPMTVILADIDKFKSINDTYGHLFGDEVIQTVAKMLQAMTSRLGGITARYGGEEFVAIIKNKTYSQIEEEVQKLHKEISQRELYCKGQKVNVTVSMGISTYPDTCEKPFDLLTKADKAMYYSKDHGRNKITLDSEMI